MINDASVVIGGGNWGIKEADILGYRLINNSNYYPREIDFATSTADGTYTDSTGMVRRSPYNLFTYSEQLDNVLWLKNNITIVPNVDTAPNGTLTADSYASTTTVGPHPCYQSKVVIRDTYTYSAYVKKVNSRYVSLKGAGGQFIWTGVIFDLDTASVVSVQHNNVPGTTGSITSEGDGWYRLSMTATSNFNDFGLQYASSPSNTFGNYGDLSIAGSGLVDYLLWGMQVVQGSSPLPYFPTTTRLNVPRIDYINADGSLSTAGRLLLEPQRTNSIRNSSMVGAAAGSPGTQPTNWTIDAGTLAYSIIGVGVENGLPYTEIRFNGTASINRIRLIFEGGTNIAAASGQTWSFSPYVRVTNETSPPSNYILQMFENTATGTFVTAGNVAFTPTENLTRYGYVRTLSGGATVGAVVPMIQMGLTVSSTYDFTIRIAAPQMERGDYATTWVPTTTAAVTRNVDIAEKFGVGSWIGSPAGTIFLQVQILSLGYVRSFISLQDASYATNSIRIETTAANRWRIQIRNASTTILDQTVTTGSAFTTGNYKIAYAYDTTTDGVAFYVNGVSLFTTTVASIPTACVNLFLGTRLAGIYDLNVSDSFDQAALFKTRLDNATLAQLTTI